jgi:hypothetical protein
MRQKAGPYLPLSIVLLFVSTTAVGQGNREPATTGSGAAVEGMALYLSPSAEPGSLTLEVRNTTPKDVVLTLGSMLANGVWQSPSAIPLTLTHARQGALGSLSRTPLKLPQGLPSIISLWSTSGWLCNINLAH